jgi:chemotaxis protein MotB
MSLSDEEDRPIYIKKIPPPPQPPHGGAWKVAYADFVTAMMAFFLLLWLLSVATVDQKIGISNYFEPIGEIKGSSGSNGVFGGVSMTESGSEQTPGQTDEMTVGSDSQVENELEKQTRQVDAHDRAKSATPTEVKREEMEFERVERAIKQALFDLPQLSALKDSVKVEVTDEGLQIQLRDQAGTSMFQPSSARLTRHAELLLLLVANMVERMPNEITISGHTDAALFGDNQGRTNWELSLERANASRRELLKHGVKGKRIDSIIGLADKVPLLIENPTSPQNRRVSIVLLREKFEIKKKTPPKPPRVL